ncbi:MAG TPA: SAM-dependent methyltransferase [Kofleriaceae bacterium]|nr:SAM-dependent methyltransferase [Kofleriaceae bacterium]
MAASRTAQYVALYRALEDSETRRPPLFRDPFAAGFLSPGLSLALRVARIPLCRGPLERYADWRAPGARSSAIGRTRFIDDVVRREVGRGARQLVLLGAGYDCRAHRMAELEGARVFEVDRPDTQSAKRARIAAAAQPGVRGDVRYVAVDFATDDLSARLLEAGWRADDPSVFVWEGVTNYLEADAVAGVLAMVGRAAPGSALVFTFIHRGVIDGTVEFDGAAKLVWNTRRLGEPWRFGLDPAELADYLARFGLGLEQDLGADEYRRLYLAAGARDLRGYAFYRVAVARVGGVESH